MVSDYPSLATYVLATKLLPKPCHCEIITTLGSQGVYHKLMPRKVSLCRDRF